MNNKLLEVVNTVRKNSGLESIDVLNDELHLKDDLEFDSISIAELIASIDVAFNIDINSDGMIQTIGDIKKVLPIGNE